MNKRLYVGNLDYATTDKELEELFATEGKVVYSKIINRADGKSRGFGFVEMETEEEAKKAMEKFDQSSFKDRTIVVNEAKSREKRSFQPGGGEQRNYRSRDKEDLNSKLKKLRKKFQ
ncbi:MAG: RNA-binding protein [Actinomycetota bacterium]|nr:RNA-binding protein [Actinomycetota bacterium]